MALTDIRLQNYRSYTDSSFELSPHVNIVVGPNAVGKSNLIESLLLILSSKAYRGKTSLINDGQAWARVDAHTDKNELRTLKISKDNDKTEQTYEINKRLYKRLPFTQKSPAVLFEPNNLFLLQDEPSARRAYLDQLISQKTQGYSGLLSRYKRALAQRNALLKASPDDESQMFVWSLRLSELADKMVHSRLQTVEKINLKISDTYSQIAHKNSTVKIEYKSSVTTKGSYSANYLKKLESSLDEDKLKNKRHILTNSP